MSNQHEILRAGYPINSNEKLPDFERLFRGLVLPYLKSRRALAESSNRFENVQKIMHGEINELIDALDQFFTGELEIEDLEEILVEMVDSFFPLLVFLGSQWQVDGYRDHLPSTTEILSHVNGQGTRPYPALRRIRDELLGDLGNNPNKNIRVLKEIFANAISVGLNAPVTIDFDLETFITTLRNVINYIELCFSGYSFVLQPDTTYDALHRPIYDWEETTEIQIGTKYRVSAHLAEQEVKGIEVQISRNGSSTSHGALFDARYRQLSQNLQLPSAFRQFISDHFQRILVPKEERVALYERVRRRIRLIRKAIKLSEGRKFLRHSDYVHLLPFITSNSDLDDDFCQTMIIEHLVAEYGVSEQELLAK